MNATASLLFSGCVLMLIAAGAWWFLRHPYFSIARITVQNELVHNSALTLRANVLPQLSGNFFTLDIQAARAAFEQMPWVRRAIVRRDFPNGLRVELQEQEPVALWGAGSNAALLNAQGEVFEASTGEREQAELPRLKGPSDRSADVLAMYRFLKADLEPYQLTLTQLALSNGGNWRATLANDAVLELGDGDASKVRQRTQRFISSLGQVAQKYGRSSEALQSADLRYPSGYAVRLKGVTTVAEDAVPSTQTSPATHRRRP
jgi:cell division protein FtsQ